MKTLIIASIITLSSSIASASTLDACLSSIKVNTALKVSEQEKQTIKSTKECFKDIKAAEKARLKLEKAAIRKEKQRKTLEAKILKLQEKLKKS